MNFWTFLDRNMTEIGFIVFMLACLGASMATGSEGCHVRIGDTHPCECTDGGAP